MVKKQKVHTSEQNSAKRSNMKNALKLKGCGQFFEFLTKKLKNCPKNTS